MSLTAIIIAKNAQQTIQRAVKSAAFCDECIVVVDSATTDQTANLASKLNAKVLIQPWLGYGPQKNFGLSKTKSDWALFLDDDEVIPPTLAKEIKKITSYPAAAGPRHGGGQLPVTSYQIYWLRIVTIFLNKPLSHLYGHNPRLIKKNAGHWNNATIHEQMQMKNGKVIKLGDNFSGLINAPLIHYSHPTIKSYLAKMHRYTTLDARQMQLTGRHRSGKAFKPTIILPYFLFIKQFIKLIFYRRGILDGYPGLMWCALSSYYEYEMAKKFLAAKNNKTI